MPFLLRSKMSLLVPWRNRQRGKEILRDVTNVTTTQAIKIIR
jgi:hypothetical protein